MKNLCRRDQGLLWPLQAPVDMQCDESGSDEWRRDILVVEMERMRKGMEGEC